MNDRSCLHGISGHTQLLVSVRPVEMTWQNAKNRSGSKSQMRPLDPRGQDEGAAFLFQVSKYTVYKLCVSCNELRRVFASSTE